MARKKNTLLRTLVPLIAILVGIGVVAAVAVNTSNQSKPRQTAAQTDGAAGETGLPEAGGQSGGQPGTQPGTETGTDAAGAPEVGDGGGGTEPDETAGTAAEQPTSEPATERPSSEQPTGQPTEQAAGEDPAAPEDSADAGGSAAGAADLPEGGERFRARVFEDLPAAPALGTLDGSDESSLRIEFSPYGAGIASLQLGKGYFTEVDSEDHVELQAQRSVPRQGRSNLTAVPFAALSVTITDPAAETRRTVGLAGRGVWRPVEGRPGTFEAFIENEAGEPALRIERRYRLVNGTFRVNIERTIENLTARELTAEWSEAGPIDLPEPVMGYGGDKRRVRFGYLPSPEEQAGSTFVTADGELTGRPTVLGDRAVNEYGIEGWAPVAPLWPTPKTTSQGRRLVWVAVTGRYFTVALHPLLDPDTVTPGAEEMLFENIESIDRLVLNPDLPGGQSKEAVILTRLSEVPEKIAPGASSETAMGVYAGPLLHEHLRADPLLVALNLDGLVVYNFGGFCGEMCTFGWLSYVLIAVLRFAHSLTGDWAVAIILLVLIVRTVLHPITKWSQIRLQRFSKQMQAIQPKQQKIREKYKDDQKRQQQEMAKLWQEEGINPAGALGCLPMLLQSPVWIALYASLFFMAELRHEPAFWGVFQKMTGGEWLFLADLARPDRMLPLPEFMHFTPPLVGKIYGEVSSINLLPVLMGVVFFLHQKYLQPPSSTSMSPEMEQQQKIMKVMFPLMMPIFMYAAPSGLTIYFITNSTLGIIENKHIRSSAEKKGLLDPEKIKAEKMAKRQAKGKPGKPGGFMAKLQAMAEQGQQLQQQQKKQVQNTARKPEVKPKNYKKRK